MENKYNIPEEFLGKKREDYLSLDSTYMLNAVLWAGRSKDPSTQVGACFVNEKGRIISVGYNGSPNNWEDDEFPWGRDSEQPEYTKYPYVIHAEMNGILNYNGRSDDFENSTIYVTLFPCSNCAKFLVQRGIKKIVYLSDKYKDTPDNVCAKILLKKCGVEYINFNDINKEDIESVNLSLRKEDVNNPIKILKYANKNNNE